RAIDPLGRIGVRRKVGTAACKDDAATARRNHALLDRAEGGQSRPDGGEPGVIPYSIKSLGHAAFPRRRKLDGAICLYILSPSSSVQPVWKTCPLCISRQHCFPQGGLMTCRWWCPMGSSPGSSSAKHPEPMMNAISS